MKKTIGVKLTDGSYVEAVWYDDSHDIYHSGTRIGSARTLQVFPEACENHKMVT